MGGRGGSSGLSYYTKPEDVPQKENAGDLMMEFLKS